MRNKILMLSAAAAVFMATPAMAHSHYHSKKVVVPVAGAVVGTVVGVGIYNGWFGSTVGGAVLPTTVGGAVAGGLLAGIGTVALLHATFTPCTGLQAVFSPFFPGNARGCVDGKYVGHKHHHRHHHRVVRARS
jgi:hypothetical protein